MLDFGRLESLCQTGERVLRTLLVPVDSEPIAAPKFIRLLLVEKGKRLGSWCRLPAETDDVVLRDADVEEVLQELVERVIRVAANEDLLGRGIVQDSRQESTNERLSGTYNVVSIQMTLINL